MKWLRIAKVLETFLAEAAVLIAVFPILDVFVQYGGAGVTWRLVVTSGTLTLVLLGLAFAIAVIAEEE